MLFRNSGISSVCDWVTENILIYTIAHCHAKQVSDFYVNAVEKDKSFLTYENKFKHKQKHKSSEFPKFRKAFAYL